MSFYLRPWAVLLLVLLVCLSPFKAQSQTPPGLTVLRELSDTYNSGQYPNGRLLADPAGFFYGVTYSGGVHGAGQLYKITSSGTLTSIHDFAPNLEGSNPVGTLAEDNSGNLYGVLNAGGSSGYGVIYKIDTTGTFNLLHTFLGGSNDGATSYGGLTLGSDGKLYGTTQEGGPYNEGVVFTLYTDGSGFTLLHTFGASGDGYNSANELLQGNGGYLYGTTLNGGVIGYGTAFVLSTAGDGTLYKHYDFAGAYSDGAYPGTGFARDSSGNLYGITYDGGAFNLGAIYKLVYSGGVFTETLLYSFAGLDGSFPRAGLIVAKNNNLYGITTLGGLYGYGTAFRYGLSGSIAGQFANLHSFVTKEAFNTQTALSQLSSNSDTNLYGVSYYGGLTSKNNTFGYGAAFKMTTSGALTRLASFDLQNIYTPYTSPVTQANDGYFYSTTEYGGAFGNGALYKTDSGGHVTIVHPFNDSTGYNEGQMPQWGVILPKMAHSMARQSRVDSQQWHTLPLYSSHQRLLCLASICLCGRQRSGGLIQGSDGNLYGVCEVGGGGECRRCFLL